MSFFRQLERRLQFLAVPHVILALVAGQTFFYLSALLVLVDPSRLVLSWSLVADGEWWRLASFTLVPPDASPVFIAFALYMFYFFGSTLEHEWGELRLNLFLLAGWALTVGSAFMYPDELVHNGFIGNSVFLAFGYLFPDFVLYLFFILPVKVKWLALVNWLYLGYVCVTGSSVDRVLILASTGNFLLFFGPRIVSDLKSGKRRLSRQATLRTERRQAEAAGPRHRCVVCGKTSDSHPQEDFRYCSKCAGDQCYCSEHLRAHVHIGEGPQ